MLEARTDVGARFRLDGLRAFVTGGAGGIGSSIAGTFVAAGATVALLDRDGPQLRSVARNLAGPGSRPITVKAEVTRPAEVRRAVAEAARKLKGLDVLVTAAGVTAPGDVATTSSTVWRHVLDINLSGTFHVCQEAVPYLQRSPAGTIVTISSVYSLIGGRDRAAYSASKGGVDALTRSMAADLAPSGIRVNSVNPGFIRTAMTQSSQDDPRRMRFFRSVTPLPRLGDPRDVADAVLFLASPASSFITGVCLPVDGGRSLGR